MIADLQAVVAAYWRHHQLSQGGRQQRLAAQDLDGALVDVDELVAAADEPLAVLDALLAAPDADPGHVGAGLLEELLVARGPDVEQAVAQRCRQVPVWREAVDAVWLDDADRRRLPLLAPYLPAR